MSDKAKIVASAGKATKLTLFLLVSASMLASTSEGAQAQRLSAARELFQQALYEEEASGDLQAAIGLYRRVVEEFPTERSLAARALVQLGSCFEKLGDDQAREAYERVISDYGDQDEQARVARGRLAALEPPPTPEPFRRPIERPRFCHSPPPGGNPRFRMRIEPQPLPAVGVAHSRGFVYCTSTGSRRTEGERAIC